MPIYEYRCEACGHILEVMQKVDDPPAEKCEVCGGHLVRVFHPVAIHFRGSGFYTTDYGRSAGGPRSGRVDGEGTSSSESKESKESKERKQAGDGKEGTAKTASQANDSSGGGTATEAGNG